MILNEVKECYLSNCIEFQRLFGIRLLNFWDFYTGFDIVKFDSWQKVADNVSLKEHIQKKYGEKATMLIEKLIHIRR